MGFRKWLKKDEEAEASRLPTTWHGVELEARIVGALRKIFDPELPANIYDLGLIYGLDADEATGAVHIRMTLTAPGCPVAGSFPGTVAAAVQAVEGVSRVDVELVWEPPWSPDLMSESARLDLGMMDW